MSEPLENTTSNPLTSSAEGFPVRTSATLASGLESTASEAGCGLSSTESFASYDPATRSWRTSQLCFNGELSEFSETWPRAGMTRNGTVSQLPILVPRILERGYSLLPTPVSAMAQGSNGGGNHSDIRDHVEGPISPDWIEHLMGFPIGWTDLNRSATPSSRKSQSGSEEE